MNSRPTFRFLCFAACLLGSTSFSFGQKLSGVDKTTFDANVRLQDDFYNAVNGTWLKTTDIPSDKSNYGSFTVLADLSEERLRTIIEEAAAATNKPGSDAQKVGDLYKSFMDEKRVSELGAAPIKKTLGEIDAIGKNAPGEQLASWFGKFQKQGIGSPLGMYVSQDAKNSTEYIISLYQSGTSLPDRDYYLEDDPKYLEAREALKTYVAQLFKLAALNGGMEDDVAEKILALETKLAEIQWERTELRDAEKRYNKFARADLDKLTPNFRWQSFFRSADLNDTGDVIVTAPSFFEGLNKIIQETPMETWKLYMKFNALDGAAPFLSQNFIDAHFAFHSKALQGIPEQKPRWKRGVRLVEQSLGEVVGRLYVEKHFPPEAKARMEELVANLVKAFEQSIDELTWMTDATKAKAKEKLSKFRVKIGYPNVWKDYSKLTVDNDLVGNVLRSNATEFHRNIDKLGKPIDREEWGMTPQTVNAYYNPTKNEIVFPAAILQPPFFNMEADDAVNYGGIGAVIGHEISHGFDDQGSKYDGDGNLVSWWTAKDRHEFEAITKRLVDQFNEYSPLPGKNVDGQLTLGENIADLSGLAIAHKAYKISLNGKESPKLDNWTGDQRFFLGWSQVWRRKYRDAEMMRRLLTDPHAPSWYRANGPVINIDAFYDAFTLKPEDALFRPKEERIKIW